MKQTNASKHNPLVSVLMPIHNAERFLEDAINSIKAQTHENWELIAIDDASTDSSFKILTDLARKDSRIKVFQNKKKHGIGYSLNHAIEKASGEYLARMDADDISTPDRFEKQIRLLSQNPRMVACGGQVAVILSNGRTVAIKRFPTESKKLHRMIMKMVPIQHPAMMAKAKVLKKYRFREDIYTAEDVDMLFYLLTHGELGNVASLIYKYRKTDANNGYHNVKQTFYITFASRFEAIVKYGYRPKPLDVLASLSQFLLVSILPSKAVVFLFEAIRFEPSFWKRFIYSGASYPYSRSYRAAI